MVRVLFLGTAGFPFGMAEVEKQTLIARSLQEQGCEVTFICKKSFSSSNDLPYRGDYKNIRYIYTNFSSKRLHNNILNRILWIAGNILEKFYVLIADFDYAIVNSRDYSEIRIYAKLIHLRKRKIFLTHVEDYRSMHPNPSKRMLKKIENFENKTWFVIDGAFPISEELTRQIRSKNPVLPILKIPVLVDITEAEKEIHADQIINNYFIYCGSSDYAETIDYIISGFETIDTRVRLLLVIGGSPDSMKTIQDRINRSIHKDKIIIKSNLPKEQLWNFYKNALALLIPLNFNQRDKARFPHKIGEYCAAGRPIITSDWGEIPLYFCINENAILLNNNDPRELGNALNMIESNPELGEKLGKNALQLARDCFNYKSYGMKILNFVNQ